MTRGRLYTICCIALVIQSCARAGASGISAQDVNPPASDVRCFAIIQDGRAVGGNCIPR